MRFKVLQKTTACAIVEQTLRMWIGKMKKWMLK